jgi:hypothetical protein
MVYLLVGVLLFIASIGGLWFSLPVGGHMRPFLQGGRDILVAIAVTTGIGLGVSAFIAGVTSLGGQ